MTDTQASFWKGEIKALAGKMKHFCRLVILEKLRIGNSLQQLIPLQAPKPTYQLQSGFSPLQL